MAKFTVNGRAVTVENNQKLLRYLRDELRLTSVKDGCSEGACGTCTILVDGRAVRACILTTKKAAGKSILTVEGLSPEEQEAFVYAFGAVGAVQCGFCIPGMVLSGKALLDVNPNPTEAEIKKAIRGNVCRCTGYKKIIEGIALAGAILRGEAEIDPTLEEGAAFGVGDRAFRADVRGKVLGTGEYCDDLYLDGMVYASAVRSQYPRARVLDIDAGAALALPGVLAVLTAEDVPHNKVGHIQQDWDVMISRGDITRCVGDAICLVVAETEEILKQDICKINCRVDTQEEARQLQEYLQAHADALVNAPSNQGHFEITASGVNKGTAILHLADRLGIDAQDVAVYGDGGNDLEMLTMFAHSYAPCTAQKEAQMAASAIIGSYQSYSVAKHIAETLVKEGE